MKAIKRISVILIVCNALFYCGKTSVDVGEYTYEPKIVINGLLYPDQHPRRIKISRNYPVNAEIDPVDALIEDADVQITDLDRNGSEQLHYNPQLWCYQGDSMVIRAGGNYRLNVRAEIEGQLLEATSETTVPETGFEINEQQSCSGDIYYRQRDAEGNLEQLCVVYRRSPSAEFYVLSLVALDADSSTFVTNNPYGLELDAEFLNDNLQQLKNEEVWAPPDDRSEGFATMEIPWLDVWFYGRYRGVMYAGDRNFFDFFITHERVQDIDGNLREPRFHIEGDGIGLFGSALADTIYFNILQGR